MGGGLAKKPDDIVNSAYALAEAGTELDNNGNSKDDILKIRKVPKVFHQKPYSLKVSVT